MNTPIFSRKALALAVAKYTDDFYEYYLEYGSLKIQSITFKKYKVLWN